MRIHGWDCTTRMMPEGRTLSNCVSGIAWSRVHGGNYMQVVAWKECTEWILGEGLSGRGLHERGFMEGVLP
jgi:hypothetical protein